MVNQGYTKGNNTAIELALKYDPDYIFLLNNDTVIDKTCISQIVTDAEKSERIGLVSPIIYFYEEPEKIQFIGSQIKWKNLTISHFNNIEEISNEDVCLWGTALLIKRSLLDTIGFLKDKYFAYWEDTEYSLRSLQNNFINIVCSQAKVYHVGQAETSEKQRPEYFYYYMNRNKVFLGDDFIQTRRRLLKYKMKCIAETSNYIRHMPIAIRLASIEGLWDGLNKEYGRRPIKKRIPILFKKFLVILSWFYPLFILDILTLNIEQLNDRIERLIKKKN
jgi:GT2 family glycosyltransferase